MGHLHMVRSKRLTGHMSVDSATTGTIVVEQRRPNMIRENISLSGQTIVRAFDGRTGWTLTVAGTDSGLTTLDGDDLQNISAEADFDGALIDARVKSNQVELMGVETVAGRSAYALKVTLRNGFIDYWYVDTLSALPIKWEGTRIINGKPVVFDSYFRDYFTVEGQQFVRDIETGSPGDGGSGRQRMTIDHVEINPPLDNTRFTAPVDTAHKGAPN